MCFAFSATAAELIVNGSFEDPLPGNYQYYPGGDSTSIVGWTTIYTGVEKFAPAVVFMGSSARDGDFVLDLNTDFGVGGGIEQTVATNPGGTYVLSFSVGSFFSRGRSGVGNIEVVINGTVYPYSVATLADTIQWTDFSITFVATSTSTTISFRNFDLPDTTFSLLDNVSLEGMPFMNPDFDADGVIDAMDACPSSDVSGTVIIAGCNTGATNVLTDSGCTVSDRVGLCGTSVRNHGDYVSCIAHLTNALKAAGIISGKEKGAIQRCAAKSNIGK